MPRTSVVVFQLSLGLMLCAAACQRAPATGGSTIIGNSTAAGSATATDRASMETATSSRIVGTESTIRNLGLTAGGNQTCIIEAGGASCWGENGAGQLGDGTIQDRNIPTPVTILSDPIVELAMGYTHACALTAAGEVACWGNNPANLMESGRIAGFKSVTAGASHACGLTTRGGVLCWGENKLGGLGDGTTEDRRTPVEVNGLTNDVTVVSAGVDYSCAVQSGNAKCWGSNDSGQLGDGTYVSRLISVSVVRLESKMTAIAAGVMHTCAWKEGGEVWCWGDNQMGELGYRAGGNSTFPVKVRGMEGGVIAVAVGGSHTCALTVAGGVKCWGNNEDGQLGDGTTASSGAPVDVSGLTGGVVAIAAGASHTCALLKDGSVKCWGVNVSGQLGNGSFQNSNTPVKVFLSQG